MALGLSRREQWALLAVVGIILAGLTVQTLRQPAAAGSISGALTSDVTGTWQKITEFQAGHAPHLAGTATATTTTATASAGRVSKAAAPTGAGTEGLDLNRANADDLDRLPGIGPARAQAILAVRSKLGQFHSVDDLEQVSGIGAKTLDKLRPYVFVVPSGNDRSSTATASTSAAPGQPGQLPTKLSPNAKFSLGPAPVPAEAVVASAALVPAPIPHPLVTVGPTISLRPTPAALGAVSRNIVAKASSKTAPKSSVKTATPEARIYGRTSLLRRRAPARAQTLTHLVNINTAGEEELELLNGVGPAIAQRIVEDRQVNGPYRRLEDIERVKGIGPLTFQKMQFQITLF